MDENRFGPQVVYGTDPLDILLLKLDHIGDFFLAYPAFKRIRDAFPNARLTLVCGPWMKAIAADLGCFDLIKVFEFFPEQSRNREHHYIDPKWIAAKHREFANIFAGSFFDLAIDFRYDLETRRLLSVVDAKYRVGIGDSGEFPFLDIAIPSDRPQHQSAQFNESAERRVFEFGKNGGGVHIARGRRDLELRFVIEDPTSPLKLGASADDRNLGVALRQAKITRRPVGPLGMFSDSHFVWTGTRMSSDGICRLEDTVAFAAASGDNLSLGWADVEDFGVWSIGSTAVLRLPVELSPTTDLTLGLLVDVFTCAEKPRSVVDIYSGERMLSHVVVCGGGNPRTLLLTLEKQQLEASWARCESREFFVGFGRCTIIVRLEGCGAADLEGRSIVTIEAINSVDKVLGECRFAGADLKSISSNKIDFAQTDPAAAVRMRVSVKGDAFAFGLRINSFVVEQTPRKYAPTMHMSDWAALLADIVVRRFSPAADLLDLPPFDLAPAIQTRLNSDRCSHRKVVLIAMGANKDVTKWPRSYYSALVKLILTEFPASSIYLVGARRESAEAEQVVLDLDSQSVINLCGSTTILQLSALLESASLFIGNSTGTTHIAAMTGIPTLTISSASNHPQQWAAVGRRASSISLDVPCKQCHIISLGDCHNAFRCMTDLTPAMVYDRVRQMLFEIVAERACPLASERDAT